MAPDAEIITQEADLRFKKSGASVSPSFSFGKLGTRSTVSIGDWRLPCEHGSDRLAVNATRPHVSPNGTESGFVPRPSAAHVAKRASKRSAIRHGLASGSVEHLHVFRHVPHVAGIEASAAVICLKRN